MSRREFVIWVALSPNNWHVRYGHLHDHNCPVARPMGKKARKRTLRRWEAATTSPATGEQTETEGTR